MSEQTDEQVKRGMVIMATVFAVIFAGLVFTARAMVY